MAATGAADMTDRGAGFLRNKRMASCLPKTSEFDVGIFFLDARYWRGLFGEQQRHQVIVGELPKTQ
jgi:hypothetical protein